MESAAAAVPTSRRNRRRVMEPWSGCMQSSSPRPIRRPGPVLGRPHDDRPLDAGLERRAVPLAPAAVPAGTGHDTGRRAVGRRHPGGGLGLSGLGRPCRARTSQPGREPRPVRHPRAGGANRREGQRDDRVRRHDVLMGTRRPRAGLSRRHPLPPHPGLRGLDRRGADDPLPALPLMTPRAVACRGAALALAGARCRRSQSPRGGRNQSMKVYDFAGAPNLRVYMAEKGLDIPTESVDILSGQNRSPEFLKKNPLGGLPVLELDDGSHLTESLAIMEYLEELHPKPSMLGNTPLERARVREAERICEIGVLSNVGTIFQNTHPFFAQRVKQSPDAAETAKNRLNAALKVLDARLATRKFVAGDAPTIGDCTLLAALEFASFAGIELDPAFTNVHRWYADFKQRPSAQP